MARFAQPANTAGYRRPSPTDRSVTTRSTDSPLPTAPDVAPRARGPVVGVIRGFEGDVTEADDAFLEIVGYTRADLEAGQMSWREMTPKEYLHLDDAGIRQAAASGGFTAPYQKEFFRKDGSRVPVLLVCAFIPDTPGKWMGYVVDLSPPPAQRADSDVAEPHLGVPLPQEFYARLMGELLRERTRVLAMLDNTDALLWAVNPELRLLTGNEAFQASQRRESGRDLEVGEPLMALPYPPEQLREWEGWYRRALRGERFSARSAFDRAEGGPRYENVFSPIVDPRLGIVGVTVVAHDVTARDAAAEALRTSEARFRALVTASPSGIFLADPSGHCVFANPRLAEIWNLSPAEMLGTGYTRHIHPDDREAVARRWREASAHEDEVEVEYRLVFPTGGQRFVRVRTAPVDEGGGRTGFVGVVDDDTERRALASRLRQSEKMQSLGTLAGGIAHDFNNMLGVVMGYAELALADAAGLPALQADLAEIRTASLRARDLVQQILTFSRRAEREPAPVDLRAVTAESVRLLRATLPAGVALDVRLPDEPVPVLGDGTALQQVIVNLCANAEYAMRGLTGGSLVVTLEAEGAEHPGQVVLLVRDSGVGMDADVRERLFEPFFTTKPLGDGTGMGLAVVHGIVAAHSGTISVESAPGAGAAFRVTLPAGRETPPATAGAAEPSRGSGRVLVVEDEPALARFVERALTRAGYTVTSRRDGGEALHAFNAAPDAVDVVVTDVALPGITGDVLTRELRRVRPSLPVLLMTGFSHTVTPERARELGAAGLLHKPVSAADLVAAVRSAMRGATTA